MRTIPKARSGDMSQSTAFTAEYYSDSASTDSNWRSAYRKRRGHYTTFIRRLRGAAPLAHDIVEVGCGVGLFTYALLNSYPRNTRIVSGDISEYAVGVGKEKTKAFPNVEMKILDAQELQIPAASADLLISLDVVEHLPDPKRFFAEASRVLRPGGVLFFSTPNTRSLGSRLKEKDISNGCTIHTWTALRDPTHIGLRPIGEWQTMCRDAGFRPHLEGTDFLWDPPYFKRLPIFPQKLLFTGSSKLLSKMLGFTKWRMGENYYGIWRKSS